METHYGIKKLTQENWLMADPATASFFRFGGDAGVSPIEGEEWLGYFREPQLAEFVPIEIQKLFAVAQGCLCYGHFYYPLYTLGLEQVSRVAEAAVMLKCRLMSAPSAVKNYSRAVQWLISENAICGAKIVKWESNVHLRNSASHPHQQAILPPTVVRSMIVGVIEDIDSLFAPPVCANVAIAKRHQPIVK